MKRSLLIFVNWLAFLTSPIWGGVVIFAIIVIGVFYNPNRNYSRDFLSGRISFLKALF
jgi:hypothetical protein